MKFDLPPTINELPLKKDFRDLIGYERRIVFERAVLIYHRSRLSEAQNHKCCWCGCEMTDERGLPTSSTVEHVVPKSEGGANHPDNYAVACHYDNQKRREHPMEFYMEVVAKRKEYPLNKKQRYHKRRKTVGLFKAGEKKFIQQHQDNRLVWG